MRRVLYIAYYFPPAGGPGVQRSLKFVRYLPAYGWLPTVVTVRPEDAAWPALDESMSAEVPEDVDVIRTSSSDPYALYARLRGRRKDESVGVGFADEERPDFREKLARFIRANVFLPDARVGWVRHARRAATELAAENGFDAVVTSGPPHSSHAVGRTLRKRAGLPWLADFRDPWTEVSYYDQLPFLPWSRAVDRWMERRVLREADGLLTVSPALGVLLGRKTSTPVAVIPNGFDPEDFAPVDPLRKPGFNVVHVGTLTAGQNPEAVWSAVAAMQETPAPVGVHLVGRVDAAVSDSVDRAGISAVVTRTPYVPHREAIAHMKGADVLLLAVPRTSDNSGILTGKVFEYLAAGRPVLALGPVDSDVGSLLRESGAGTMFEYGDAAGIRDFLDAQRTESPGTGGAAPGYLARYERKALAGRLAEELNRIAGQ